MDRLPSRRGRLALLAACLTALGAAALGAPAAVAMRQTLIEVTAERAAV